MGVSNYVLATDAHRSLVDALRSLEDEGICEVHVLDAERVGVRAQIELAARSTVSLEQSFIHHAFNCCLPLRPLQWLRRL